MPWLPWGDAEVADWPEVEEEEEVEEALTTTAWPGLRELRTVLMTTEGFKPGGIVWE